MRIFPAAAFFCLLLFDLSAQNLPRYPEIPALSSGDAVFRQYMKDVEDFYRGAAQGNTPSVLLYTYRAKEGETLLTIAARCNILPETIATINRLPDSAAEIAGKNLLLPAGRGLFIPEEPDGDLEILLYTRLQNTKEPDGTITIRYRDSGYGVFRFYSNSILTGTERAFFLTRDFRFPLPKTAVLTSVFGMRQNPVTGTYRFHEGIDLAAPAGTPVLACRAGKIRETGYNSIYGNYVIIRHDNGTESLYGHMEKVLAHTRESVRAGQSIGEVGSTGQSTGPHLHFEVRVNGVPKDPESLVNSGIK